MLSLMQRARTEVGVDGQMPSSDCLASFSSRTQSATFRASVNFMSLASADLALHSAPTFNSGKRSETGVVMWAATSASDSTASSFVPVLHYRGQRTNGLASV